MAAAYPIPESPVATLGHITLWAGFLLAGYGMYAGIVGNLRRDRRLVSSSMHVLYAFFGVMLLASCLMIYAFVSHDWAIRYVARTSDSTMATIYKLTSYWGSLEGSLMFWVAVLAVFSAIAVWFNRKRHRDMIGYVVGTIFVVQLFFLALLIFHRNPFTTFLTPAPLDGDGLNPLLQTYWMVIHPPVLYIGFVAATIPFAFGVAAMASGRLDDRWLRSTRVWTFICWIFLSVGLVLGGRWAYEELGWGGYWAWDPVENAGLLAWFTTTAFLHSVIIQEQRGMMKRWNLLLVIVSFFLTIFGTFMTRSGIVQSVHAFGEDSTLAMFFVLFLFAILVVSLGLLLFRAPQLRSSGSLESFASREFAFLLNNWILLACALFVLFASMFGSITEAFGDRRAVTPEFYNRWMPLAGFALLFLAGAAPLLAYRRTSKQKLYSQFIWPIGTGVVTMVLLAVLIPETRSLSPLFTVDLKLPLALINFGLVGFTVGSIVQEFIRGAIVRKRQTGSDPITATVGLMVYRNRKYGGYIVHLGMAVLFFAFAGRAWETKETYTVQAKGESVVAKDYRVVFGGYKKIVDERRTRDIAKFDVYRYDEFVATLYPEINTHTDIRRTVTHEVDFDEQFPWFTSHFGEDIYINFNHLRSVQEPGQGESKAAFAKRYKNATIDIEIYVNPLVNFVWFGCGILVLGALICLIPTAVIDLVDVRRRTTPIGKAMSTALAIAVALAVTFGLTRAAQAQQGEHQSSTSGVFDHNKGNYKNRFRPTDEVSTKAMKSLVCMCGGCPPQSIHVCKCGYAAEERKVVLAMLSEMDTSTPEAAEAAYQQVLANFVDRYGNEVLAKPPESTWLVPVLVVVGGLVMLFFVARRWVERGRAAVADAGRGPSQPMSEQEEELEDRLDDELRDLD